MSSLPPQLLATLMPLGDVIASRMSGSNRSKQATTDRSRQDHFLRWCSAKGVVAGGTTLSHLQARNFVLACYAVSLTAGETLQAKRIRHATLRGYVKMACKCHTDLGLPSPRLADTDYISVILDAVKKYQSVPDRREMIHDSMYRHLVHEYTTDEKPLQNP